MKKLLIAFSVMLLGACSTTNTIGTDGYRFFGKEYENVTPGVEFVLLQNEEERVAVKKKFFGPEWKKVSAFTEWNVKEGVCKIYIQDPDWQYKPELIGHEVAHCIWGRWHEQVIVSQAAAGEPVSP